MTDIEIRPDPDLYPGPRDPLPPLPGPPPRLLPLQRPGFRPHHPPGPGAPGPDAGPARGRKTAPHLHPARGLAEAAPDRKPRSRRGRVPDSPALWLAERSPQAGFQPSFDTFPLRVAINRPERPLCFLAARFYGVGRYTDPERLTQTLRSGLGTGKAYGFGMLIPLPVPDPTDPAVLQFQAEVTHLHDSGFPRPGQTA